MSRSAHSMKFQISTLLFSTVLSMLSVPALARSATVPCPGATINGALFPAGLLPNLAKNFENNDFAIVRSMRSHALVHSLAQTWTQIGRNPAAALGNIAPNIGTIAEIKQIILYLKSNAYCFAKAV